MAHIRTLRYGVPNRARPPSTREVEIPLDKGFHYGLPEYALAPGYTPDSLNVVPTPDDVGISPRSGLSVFAYYFDIDQPEALKQLTDISGIPAIAALSGRTLHYYPYSNPTWSTLSRLGTEMSHSTSAHGEIIQANSSSTAYGIVLNATNTPKVFQIKQDAVSWSDLTTLYSIASVAYTGTVSDERLVLATLSSLDDDHPRRVTWSVRGSPTDFTLALGAGFADLTEMRGAILRLVQDTQGFVLLGADEIWRARPRRDIYAFDFIPITRELGSPFPNTADSSPFGTIFLGTDHEVYVLSGSQLRPLGEKDGRSRIQRYIRANLSDPNFVWGLYDYTLRRYYLQLTPNLGLTYDFTTDTWWPHNFYFTAGWKGTMIMSPDVNLKLGLTWDQQTLTWDGQNTVWNDEAVTRQPYETAYPLLVARIGTPYSWHSRAYDDAGYAFTSYWRSPRVSAQARRYNLDGTYVEFSSRTASTATVTHQYDSYADVQTRSLQSSRLSIAWAPAHGVSRAVSVKVEVDSGKRPQLTMLAMNLRIHKGLGGAK